MLVVRRSDLAPYIDGRPFHVITDRTNEILRLIETKSFFIERPLAERSEEYRQIIPYVVIQHEREIFVLKRLATQAEARLHHKTSIGVGGHINPDAPTLMKGLRKELDEEVHVETGFHLRFVGILNDESTEVGRVHLGAVFILEAAEAAVEVREVDKMSGEWMPVEELGAVRESMESWSQIVYDQVISEERRS